MINQANVPLHYLHHGLTPGSSLAPHSCSRTAPSGMGEIIGGNEVRKLMGWNKNSLIRKAKAMSKAKHEIHSPLSMGRQVFCHPQENPSWVTVIWEDKTITSNVPSLAPILLLPPASYAKHDTKRCRISLGLVGVCCPDCTLELLVFPSPPCWWVGERTRKDLATVQALLSSD